jgi:hypothetical protein
MKTRFAKCLGAALLLALMVSCGKTHSYRDNPVGTPHGAPYSGTASTARTIRLTSVLRDIDAYPAPKGVDAAPVRIAQGGAQAAARRPRCTAAVSAASSRQDADGTGRSSSGDSASESCSDGLEAWAFASL